MSSLPWFAWYPADYRSKTGHLSFVQDSAYRRLLDHYYLCGGNLPADVPTLYRITGAQTDEERQAIDAVVALFFQNISGRLKNNRADQELAVRAAHQSNLSQRGKRGAKARWTQNTEENTASHV